MEWAQNFSIDIRKLMRAEGRIVLSRHMVRSIEGTGSVR